MKEVHGDLWDYNMLPGYVVCITTNGTIKKNGKGVMGRGCAKEAADRHRWIPKVLGAHLKQNGNILLWLPMVNILTFPVKHNWWEQADLQLIKDSAIRLRLTAEENRFIYKYILPRPGCGNGKLDWPTVKRVLEEADLPDNVWIISR
jgi:hypothetical protein